MKKIPLSFYARKDVVEIAKRVFENNNILPPPAKK